MNETIPPAWASPASPPKPKNQRSRVLMISVGIAAAAVILAGVGSAYAIPKLMHQAQVSEYQGYIESTNTALAAEAEAALEVEALTQLIPEQERAAASFASAVAGLSATASPVFAAETAAELKSASDALTKATPTVVDKTAGAELQTAFEAQRKADTERVAAATKKLTEQKTAQLKTASGDQAKKKIEADTAALILAEQEKSIPVHALDLTADDAIGLLGLSAQPKKAVEEPSSNVTSELVEQAQSTMNKAEKAQRASEQEAAKLQKRFDEIATNVDAAIPALERAAAEAPKQAAAVIAAAPRAGSTQQAALNAAAESAGDKTTIASSSPAQLLALVQSYQTAALAVSNHHAAVLAEEAEAAAAAASGGGSDSSGGGWSDGGGWSSGGSSGGGGGGGWNDGGSSGGGSGGGGSTGGGGGGGYSGTPESWFAANCQWGYNWWGGDNWGDGYCYPNPDPDGWD